MTASAAGTHRDRIRLLGRGLCAAGLVLLFGYATVTLAGSPCLGVADILDFWRVMRPAGIEHIGSLDHPGYYVRCQFQTTAADLASAPSSSALLAWLARAVPAPSTRAAQGFDLRQMGLLDLALVALVVAAGMASGLSIALALALVFVLVDPGYLLFFNSFYADATLFIALLGSAIWLECAGDLSDTIWKNRLGKAIAWVAGLVALALLGGGSKMQYVLLPLLVLAALAPRLGTGGRAARWRALGLALILAFASALVAWNFFLGPGPRFLEFNNYHAVYGGILRVTSDPERVLAELDIPREYWELPRTDAWSAGVPVDHSVHRQLRDLSRLQLLKLYLLDPKARSGALSAIQDDLLRVESHPRGNYESARGDRGPVRRVYQVGWQFSRLSRGLLRLWRPSIGVLLAGSCLWLVAFARPGRWTGRKSVLLFLLLWVVSQFLVAVLGEGLVNLQQHLVGARLGIDLLLVFVVADVAAEVRRRRSNKSGASFSHLP